MTPRVAANPPIMPACRVLAVAAFLLAVFTPSFATAQQRLLPNLSARVEERVLFVAGNTLFSLHHEIAHALIHQFDLPVLGREEDAADGYATLAMQPNPPTLLADALLLNAADGWLFYAETAPIDQLAYIDAHPLDEQRFYRTACLIIGSDIEGFYEYGLDVGLTEERIEECPRLWQDTRRDWERLLAPHRHLGSPPTISRLPVAWHAPPARLSDEIGFLRSSGLVDDATQKVSDAYALKRPVAVQLRDCGEPAAFYDPDPPSITLCYELLIEFVDLFDQAIGVE